MRSPVRRQPSETAEELHARLSTRVAALEDRVRRLEARLRAASPRPVATPRSTSGRAAEPSKPESRRARPRCPGCTLELPPGRRGESCVWCGFVFSAVTRRRPARKKR
ncbi:hypothetical protein FJV41_44205 [Myxococcus llanfairpwllgwyngyllgogerychwyrndrobwllllantysiliogogogochensis]|uniref:Uncharacterized protein n=1 Tax=Myxococcus llanfairpwllgwyngyllgogerychwyrndrobwllllantysiliogogogochensis TaxID=2590453 RepID=A0A540WKF7_9BACT|nr:hypothetical protein FJV41_44205 [Myxococcus llanfairpwllgwyngyllgogerychwyrndrobwllllantysiliogogogochensis]